MIEPTIRLIRTDDLRPDEVASLRALFDAAWSNKDGAFSEDDWTSASGGTHVIASIGDRIVSHASVVERVLETGDLALRTGYVEAVATWPEHQGAGHATRVMRAVGTFLERLRIRRPRHRHPGVLRTSWVGALARTDGRPHRTRASSARRRRTAS